MAIVPFAAVEALVGHRFPGARYVITPHRDFLTRDVFGSPRASDGLAHPTFCYFAATAAMGGIDRLFATCFSGADEGPMIGECDFSLDRPLRIGDELDCSGEIVAVERKHGRSGVFDVVACGFELHDDSGARAGTCTNMFVFPRRP